MADHPNLKRAVDIIARDTGGDIDEVDDVVALLERELKPEYLDSFEMFVGRLSDFEFRMKFVSEESVAAGRGVPIEIDDTVIMIFDAIAGTNEE